MPVAAFFVAPKDEASREIALQPNEILTEILVPAGVTHTATYEVRQKEALDWPLAAASVALTMKGATVGSARMVLGHVAADPVGRRGGGKALVGKAINAANAEAAGKAAVADARPLSQNAYKVTLAKTAVKRALLDAVKEGLTMESLRQQKASMNRCEKLRWKGMFIEADRDPNSPPASTRPSGASTRLSPLARTAKWSTNSSAAPPAPATSNCKEERSKRFNAETPRKTRRRSRRINEVVSVCFSAPPRLRD